jgi:hypothetical protein
MEVYINCEDLEKQLDLAAPDIRYEIQQYALMGRIPKLVFLKGCFPITYIKTSDNQHLKRCAIFYSGHFIGL